MRRSLCSILTLIVLSLVAATPARAQVVTAPTRAEFQHPDADYAVTGTYHLDFYQCASLTPAGLCQGRAAVPFSSGADIPKAAVTGNATLRTANFSGGAVPGVLQSMPIGVAFVSTVIAVGDGTIGGQGQSAPSVDSNAFFARGRTPASPTATAVR